MPTCSRAARSAASSSSTDDRVARPRPVPARAGIPRGLGHRHLGGRPRRGAGPHLRRPPSRRLGRPRPADRGDRGRPPGVGVRGWSVLAGRHERRSRATARHRPGRAVPLRPDAPRVLRRRCPGRRHGRQRRLGVAQLPVADLGLLRTGVLRRRGPGPRCGLRAGLERLAPRGVGLGPPRPDHPPRDRLPVRLRRKPPPRSDATPPGASRRWPCPNAPTLWDCPASGSGTTGTRSSRPAWRRRRWCASTSAAPGCHPSRPGHRRCRSAPRSSANWH